MTTPTVESPIRRLNADSFPDWFRIDSRGEARGDPGRCGGVLLLVLQSLGRSGSEAAHRTPLEAKQSLGSGNLPLAQSDLGKIADQCPPTSAA